MHCCPCWNFSVMAECARWSAAGRHGPDARGVRQSGGCDEANCADRNSLEGLGLRKKPHRVPPTDTGGVARGHAWLSFASRHRRTATASRSSSLERKFAVSHDDCGDLHLWTRRSPLCRALPPSL